jgi:hypothetical protein
MKRGAPLRNKTPLRRKTPMRASNRFPSKGDPGTATAANDAVPASLDAPVWPKPTRKQRKAPKPTPRRPMRKALPRRVTRPGPGSDPAYLAEVRKLPCCAPRGILLRQAMHDCDGPIHAHHAGPKTNDRTAVALCWKHHQAWHDANGVFKGWRKPERREWADAAIDDTRRLVASRRAA